MRIFIKSLYASLSCCYMAARAVECRLENAQGVKNVQYFVAGQQLRNGCVAPPGTVDIMHSHVS